MEYEHKSVNVITNLTMLIENAYATPRAESIVNSYIKNVFEDNEILMDIVQRRPNSYCDRLQEKLNHPRKTVDPIIKELVFYIDSVIAYEPKKDKYFGNNSFSSDERDRFGNAISNIFKDQDLKELDLIVVVFVNLCRKNHRMFHHIYNNGEIFGE